MCASVSQQLYHVFVYKQQQHIKWLMCCVYVFSDCGAPYGFRCAYTRYCLSRSLVCDGIDHCGDRSDEINCLSALSTTGLSFGCLTFLICLPCCVPLKLLLMYASLKLCMKLINSKPTLLRGVHEENTYFNFFLFVPRFLDWSVFIALFL